MKTASDKQSWLDQNLGPVLIGILVIGVASLVAIVSFYLYHFSAPILARHDVWGQFGDFIGGSAGPLLNFLALIALLLTLWVQSRYLKKTQSQMDHQNTVASRSAQITAISTLIDSLNKQIEQDNKFTANGGSAHADGNRQRLDRRVKLVKRLDEIYEDLANSERNG